MATRPKTIFELDLELIAKRHTELLIVLGAMLISLVLSVLAALYIGSATPAASMVINLIWLLFLIAAVVAVVRAQMAMGAGVLKMVLYALVTIFISILALIANLSQAGTILRLGGAKIGFVGVSASERAKLRRGHCRGCGYDRRGLEMLQACPECNRVPQVI